MMPEAPVRFSTMNCCLSESVSFAAISRASGSTEPPGGYGDTNLTGLVGQSCEKTGNERNTGRRKTKNLEADISSPLQFQHLARFVRRRDRESQLFQDAPRLAHLLGVRFRELAAAHPQAVLQPDAHVAAHHRRHRGDEHLVAAGAEHRPAVGVAEQAVGGALHVQHGLRVRPDAAADAEHRLDEKRRLHQAPLEKMRRGIEMADVVALDLEARFILRAGLQDEGNVLEAVLENSVIRTREIRPLPGVLELLVAAEHLVEAEVHRAHVERGDLGLELQRGLQPLLDRHRRRAAGRQIDHHVARRLDLGQELPEQLRILRRAAVLRVACVEMHDRRPGLGGFDCGAGDLVRSDREIRRHAGRVDGARDCASDDDFSLSGAHTRYRVPPQTEMACPEICFPASVARNSAVFAMSCWVTVVCMLTPSSIFALTWSNESPRPCAFAAITRSMRSPSTTPGWMQLTRTLSGPASAARLSVKPTTANFAAEYGVRLGKARRPAADERLMMLPPPAALIIGIALRVQ